MFLTESDSESQGSEELNASSIPEVITRSEDTQMDRPEEELGAVGGVDPEVLFQLPKP